MNKILLGLAAAGLLSSTSAFAANLGTGTFASTGTVASNNDSTPGAGPCHQVGLDAGSANLSTIVYPGAGKSGFLLYVGSSGVLQLCNAFPATPSTGIASWNPTATCQILTVNGNAPANPVTFTFTNTVTDGYSALGQTMVSIPPTAVFGAGCQATIVTTLVRSGR